MTFFFSSIKWKRKIKTLSPTFIKNVDIIQFLPTFFTKASAKVIFRNISKKVSKRYINLFSPTFFKTLVKDILFFNLKKVRSTSFADEIRKRRWRVIFADVFYKNVGQSVSFSDVLTETSVKWWLLVTKLYTSVNTIRR